MPVYDCYMAALAHNVLKMVRRLRRGVGLPGSVVPADVIAAKVGQADDDAVAISARCHDALRRRSGGPSISGLRYGRSNVKSATFSTDPVFDHSVSRRRQ